MGRDAPPEYIPLNFYESSSESEDDGYEPGGARFEEPRRKASRQRYFADVVAARARAAAELNIEETPLPPIEHEEPEKTPYRRKAATQNEPKTIEEFIDNLLPPELQAALPIQKEPSGVVANPSPYPPKYESKQARLRLLEREILAWCGGRGIVPPYERLKADSIKFVDGELDAPFEVCLSRVVPVEAKAAKRRFKKQRKREIELERERLDGVLMDDIEEENAKDDAMKEEDMPDSSFSSAELEASNQAYMDELAAVETEAGSKQHQIVVPMDDDRGSNSQPDDECEELARMRDA